MTGPELPAVPPGGTLQKVTTVTEQIRSTVPKVPTPEKPSTHAEAWGKLIGRLIVSACGFGIAVWGFYDIVVTDRKSTMPTSTAHYIIVGGVILIGLGVAGGKKTLDVMAMAINGIRAWKSPSSPPSP